MSSLKKIGGSTAKKAYSDPEVKVTRFDNEVYCGTVTGNSGSEKYTPFLDEPA